MLRRYLWTLGYIASIIVVNILFSKIPMVITPWGDAWPPVALLVGVIFVFRDFAQREAGHRVLLATCVGILISYVMTEPRVAVASAAAFAASETLDWLIYTITKRPFEQRVFLSSLISTPIDSMVFLHLIGALSATAVALMTLSKMVASLLIFLGYRRVATSWRTREA